MGRRACTVLFRKVVGTTWPPDVVTHRQEQVSLTSIFADVAIDLNCEKVADDLPELAHGRSFESVDLRAALSCTLRTRQVPASAWVACVLIVPEIVTVVGGRYRRPLGLMFDIASSAAGPPRRGCAIAWRQVRGDPRTYLRTLAHELGHVFNLRHPGEGHEPYGPDEVNSLMVPNEFLRPRERYPDTIDFRFSAAQRAWLASGPEEHVRPGGADYGARPPDWPPSSPT